jgi:hypothetical protein
MTLSTLFQVFDTATNRPLLTGATLEDTATFFQLNAEEIEWAIEEHGVCETDVHRVEAIPSAEADRTGDQAI